MGGVTAGLLALSLASNGDPYERIGSDAQSRERMGAAGRAAVSERYARRASVDRWADLLERVAAQQALR